jgi:uncharacterized protein YwqG
MTENKNQALFERLTEQSEQSFIRINPIPVEDDLSPTTSKLMGIPYIPSLEDYPLGTDERPMLFMAQINFDELTQQGLHLADYPTTGLLQFFCEADDLWGLAGDIKVIYHQDLSKPSLMNDDIDEVLEYTPSPIEGIHRLEFSLQKEFCGFADEAGHADFYQTHPEWQALSKEEQHDFITYLLNYERLNNAGTKLGGFAFFTQQDPRHNDSYDLKLLFQIDSDNETTSQICWGDNGVGNWFISREDLKNLNFSNVLFSWDCY